MVRCHHVTAMIQTAKVIILWQAMRKWAIHRIKRQTASWQQTASHQRSWFHQNMNGRHVFSFPPGFFYSRIKPGRSPIRLISHIIPSPFFIFHRKTAFYRNSSLPPVFPQSSITAWSWLITMTNACSATRASSSQIRAQCFSSTPATFPYLSLVLSYASLLSFRLLRIDVISSSSPSNKRSNIFSAFSK